ncbi:MAG TPA: ABC transporter ATP-binding protein [Polyangiaceae bacterium]|nr:ABC transporter ATP-binding protein [Polyangiaceae bacterium]
MIEARHLTKRYGSHVAVSDLVFTVGAGEVVGFLGPNGAGKSTTLRMLSGYLGPSSGDALIAGINVVDEPLLARQKLGYMPEECPVYPELRVSEYLRFRAELKRVARSRRTSAIGRALELAGLSERQGSIVGHLSKGYRQRLGLADALLSDPPLLILDEPTSGLDPNQIREVRAVIRGLAEQHTVLLSTHILPEVEVTCDRALVIHRGHLVAQGSLEELRSRGAARSAVLVVRVPTELTLPEALKTRRTAKRALDGGYEEWEVAVDNGRDGLAALSEQLWQLGISVAEARLGGARLEEVFLELTRTEPLAS